MSGRTLRRHKAEVYAAFAVMACVTVAWCGCSGHKAEPEPAVSVQAATVQQKTIRQIVSSEAVLYAKSEASIVPKISAPVEGFYVNRGSQVHAGQLVAQLENKDLQAALNQAKGAYEQAQAAYATNTQVNLPADVQDAQLNAKETRQAMQSARMVYQSREKLYKAGAIARNLMEQARLAYVQANNQYQMAEAHLEGLQKVGRSAGEKTAEGQLAAAKGQYEAALAQFQYSEIRSPITGVVTDRPLFEGQMATAGTPLMTIMDLSHVIGRAYVSPEQASQLRVGDAATIVPGNGQPEIPAKVRVVSPAVDPNSTTVQVWVEAANPGGQLRPGSTVNVKVIARSVKDALVVPSAAVLSGDGGATSVMLIGADQHAHQVMVRTGIYQDGQVQITSGLRAGEQVVTEGAYGLPDGAKVRISKTVTTPASVVD
ncbi:MAG: efflux RND transporter periplasmic adaptor subunit [Candidatus Acidiferrales bacterium]